MNDKEIVDLYWARSETAISATTEKYARYCHAISHNILQNRDDADECVNETYLKAWNAIPPSRPEKLSTFLGKIVRNLSLNRYQKRHAEKRGAGQVELAWEELEECIADSESINDDNVNGAQIVQTINLFLAELKPMHRKIFVSRYWYLYSVDKIAVNFDISVNNAKQILFRTREKLRAKFEKEGVIL